MAFIRGLVKVAALSESETQNLIAQMAIDGAIGPLGTAASTLGARPKGHSRIAELGARLVLPGLSGLTAAALLGGKTPAGRLLALAGGALAGSAGAHTLINSRYYKDGTLKPEYRDQEGV